ncbi:hypothetical protein ACFYPG_00600 [Micromonospora sp. NPDC005553]|uniref:hypothetical protein n=1 Tax=Micromonospora sp. NPDC005553 TaxID=3364232 RepID=UPI0036B5B610
MEAATPSTNRRDIKQLHAILTLTIGQSISADDLAEALGWPLPHVHDTINALTTVLHRRGTPLRLTHSPTHVRLHLAPGALNSTIEHRLAQLHHIRQLHPMVFHLIYRVLHGDHLRADALTHLAPGALREALHAGTLTSRRPPPPTTNRTDDHQGQAYPFALAPDVAFSLGLIDDLRD